MYLEGIDPRGALEMMMSCSTSSASRAKRQPTLQMRQVKLASNVRAREGRD